MKSALIILFAAFVVSNGGWIYHMMDQSVTLQHQTDELGYQQRINELLAMLVVDLQGTKSKDDILAIVRQKYRNRIVKAYDDAIEIEGVVLRFEGERLASVSQL